MKYTKWLNFLLILIIFFYFEELYFDTTQLKSTSWFDIHQSTTYADVWLFDQNFSH